MKSVSAIAAVVLLATILPAQAQNMSDGTVPKQVYGRVQVLEGLKEGERVVTEGSFILKSELLKGELGEEG